MTDALLVIAGMFGTGFVLNNDDDGWKPMYGVLAVILSLMAIIAGHKGY